MTPFYERDGLVVFHGSAQGVLPLLEPMDHVITDPPYAEKVCRGVRRLGGDGVAAVDVEFDTMSGVERRAICAQIARLVRRWAIVFSDVESCHLWREGLVSAGMRHVRSGAWVKDDPTPQFSGDRPAMGFEIATILHAPSRRLEWNGGGRAAVWHHGVARTGRVHPTEKPWRLLAQLIEDFSRPHETIVDPFAGSGSLAVAARYVGGRRVVLIEKQRRWCEEIVSRIGAAPNERQGQLVLQW